MTGRMNITPPSDPDSLYSLQCHVVRHNCCCAALEISVSGYPCAACNTGVEQKTGSATKNLLSAVRDINTGAEAWEEVKANKVVLTIVTEEWS